MPLAPHISAFDASGCHFPAWHRPNADTNPYATSRRDGIVRVENAKG
jgi:hypothetical protein